MQTLPSLLIGFLALYAAGCRGKCVCGAEPPRHKYTQLQAWYKIQPFASNVWNISLTYPGSLGRVRVGPLEPLKVWRSKVVQVFIPLKRGLVSADLREKFYFDFGSIGHWFQAGKNPHRGSWALFFLKFWSFPTIDVCSSVSIAVCPWYLKSWADEDVLRLCQGTWSRWARRKPKNT